MTIKFPKGKVGSELLHYIAADDDVALAQRSELAKSVAAKCFVGKPLTLLKEEFEQLIRDVNNAIDIKANHVGNGSWTKIQQQQLQIFRAKLLQKITEG